MVHDISLAGSFDRYGAPVDHASGTALSLRDGVVLTPHEPLVIGGAAEGLDRQIQRLFQTGHRQLIVDLGAVPAVDGAGVGVLVRALTRAKRLGGALRLVAPQPAVAAALQEAHLSSVFEIHDSIDAARIAAWPWRAMRLATAGSLLCAALVAAGLMWPFELAGVHDAAELLASGKAASRAVAHQFQPFVELLKLVAAALIGLLVTAIHRPAVRDRRGSMPQAQTLLCVSGAVMMIIIGNSLARAFGIAGAASIIRFRTPVDDPKDVTVLFLLMGLGMSVGLGAFAVAGLGTAFLCVALVALERMTTDPSRAMTIEIRASDVTFPTGHVEGVFARNHIVFEPRDVSTADGATIRYQTWLPAGASLDDLSDQLMTPGCGIKGVSWEHAKRERV
jgi:anti-anti-sigma factor